MSAFLWPATQVFFLITRAHRILKKIITRAHRKFRKGWSGAGRLRFENVVGSACVTSRNFFWSVLFKINHKQSPTSLIQVRWVQEKKRNIFYFPERGCAGEPTGKPQGHVATVRPVAVGPEVHHVVGGHGPRGVADLTRRKQGALWALQPSSND